MSGQERPAATMQRVSIYREKYWPVFEVEIDVEGEHEIPVALYERYMAAMREYGVVQEELRKIADAKD